MLLMFKFYRHISNLHVMSKLLKQMVARQVSACHSTATTVLRVLSDMLKSVDGGEMASLVLFDLSATFDTVDHDILFSRLQITV